MFDAIIERGKQVGADLILATDPDCDRLGCAAPLTVAARRRVGHAHRQSDRRALGRLPAGRAKAAGTLTPRALHGQNAGHHRVDAPHRRRLRRADRRQLAGGLQVDRREMDQRGPQDSCFGAEESYGFLAGDHVRDKDAAVAAMLLGRIGRQAEGRGQDAARKARRLFRRYGCHTEGQISVQMPGEKGWTTCRP